MRFYIFILLLWSFNIFAQPKIEPLCEPLAKSLQWQTGNTIHWVGKVAPDFAALVNNSKNYAVKNQTFKSSLMSVGYDPAKIDQNNQLRLLSECDLTQIKDKNTCHHFKVFCANSVTTKTLNDTFDGFNYCAIKRAKYCGESFQTPKGIRNNLQELEDAAKAIFAVQDKIRQNPTLSEYFKDVINTFEALKAKLALARGNLEEALKKINEEVQADYEKKKKEDQAFKTCCDTLDACSDYLKKENLEDKHHILKQVNFCSISGQSNNDDQIKSLEKAMEAVQNISLKNLVFRTLDKSVSNTILEFASLYKAMTGKAPDPKALCEHLPSFCSNKEANKALSQLNLDNIQKMNTLTDIQSMNSMAKEMNNLCQEAKKGHVTNELELKIQTQLTDIMYKTRIGQLMAIDSFRQKVPPFDQKKCFAVGSGFELIPEDSKGEKLVNDATWGILKLQKDKAKALTEKINTISYTSGFVDPSDPAYKKMLKYFLANDPYMVKAAIQNSGNPAEALWICKETAGLYNDESNTLILTIVGTGTAIAGSLVATVFTFGMATPLLVGSIALATGIGVYNLDRSLTARHNAEMTISVNSAEKIMKTMELPELDLQVKAAYVEVGMGILPGAIKGLSITGKALGPLLNSSSLINGISSGIKLSGPSQALMQAIKTGGNITDEMIQKALASRFVNANPKNIAAFKEILKGTTQDMALEMITWASLHPDPFSERGMEALALSLATSMSFNTLSIGAQNLVMKYKAQKLSDIRLSNIPDPVFQYLPNEFANGATSSELIFWKKLDAESSLVLNRGGDKHNPLPNTSDTDNGANTWTKSFERGYKNSSSQENVALDKHIENIFSTKLSDEKLSAVNNGVKVNITHPNFPYREVVLDPAGVYFRSRDTSLIYGPKDQQQLFQYLDKNGKNIVEHFKTEDPKVLISKIKEHLNKKEIEFNNQDIISYLENPNNAPNNMMVDIKGFKISLIKYWNNMTHFNVLVDR
jgi:hypothetical protein